MEPGTLQRAQAGDEQAFQDLTARYRRELHVHCYRMLGSLTDAEDMVQETLLAAWRGLPEFRQQASLRTWLYRIATNRCLNALRDAGRRIPTEPVPPFDPPEPTQRDEIRWLQPYPDILLEGVHGTTPGPEAQYEATETIELAFIAGLQRMSPRQTATLVLRDVLGFSTDEVADLLGTSSTTIKGALQRARASIGQHPAGNGEDLSARRRNLDQEREVGRRFASAYQAGDMNGLLELLTDDAWLSMPPAPHRYHGIAAIHEFWQTSFVWRADRRVVLLPTQANTQPAFASYMADGPTAAALPAGLFLLTVEADRIAAIARFHDDALYSRFGLPPFVPDVAATKACGTPTSAPGTNG